MKNYRKSLIYLAIFDVLVIMILLGYYKFNQKDEKIENYTDAKFVFDDVSGKRVIPSGESLGLYMKTEGVLVVDVGDIETEKGGKLCPVKYKLKTGDYITEMNGETINNKSQLIEIISNSNGDVINIGFERDGHKYNTEVAAIKAKDGEYKLGLWVKDDVAGIGTVTFIYGDKFMALGHSISDSDTGLMMKCQGGAVYKTDITNINKSHSDEPGELQGKISYKSDMIGEIYRNTYCGIVGKLDKDYISKNYDLSEGVYIGKIGEIHEGEAYLYSRLSGENVEYKIHIDKVYRNRDNKNLEFTVVDQRLIDLTGGVVQGMSGSPIIQDEKLIGAVTHVFVDDPTKGYGIFIEEMLGENN